MEEVTFGQYSLPVLLTVLMGVIFKFIPIADRWKALLTIFIGTGLGLLALAYAGFDDEILNLHWHELSEQGPDETELVEGVTLRTVVVPHPDNVPTLAARWDLMDGPSIAFVTDTVPNAATVDLARDCDLLIHESNFSAVLQPDVDISEYYHSTAQQAGEMARQAACPRLALVHLGSEIGEHPDVLADEARADTDLDVFVPEDGERVRVGKS